MPLATSSREPLGDRNSTIACKSWNSGFRFCASFIDFARDAIEMGAAAGTEQFIVKTSLGSEGGAQVLSELERDVKRD